MLVKTLLKGTRFIVSKINNQHNQYAFFSRQVQASHSKLKLTGKGKPKSVAQSIRLVRDDRRQKKMGRKEWDEFKKFQIDRPAVVGPSKTLNDVIRVKGFKVWWRQKRHKPLFVIAVALKLPFRENVYSTGAI